MRIDYEAAASILDNFDEAVKVIELCLNAEIAARILSQYKLLERVAWIERLRTSIAANILCELNDRTEILDSNSLSPEKAAEIIRELKNTLEEDRVDQILEGLSEKRLTLIEADEAGNGICAEGMLAEDSSPAESEWGLELAALRDQQLALSNISAADLAAMDAAEALSLFELQNLEGRTILLTLLDAQVSAHILDRVNSDIALKAMGELDPTNLVEIIPRLETLPIKEVIAHLKKTLDLDQIAECIKGLSPSTGSKFIEALSIRNARDILKESDLARRAIIFEELDPKRAAVLLKGLKITKAKEIVTAPEISEKKVFYILAELRKIDRQFYLKLGMEMASFFTSIHRRSF
jgi:Mg/Co/Ni transporter MgtE